VRRGERPLYALRERGVEYVEVRLIDLDPFSPIGITADTVHFLDVFLLHCLLSDSRPDTPQEIETIARNQQHVSERGREPGLTLARQDRTVQMAEWGREVLDACQPIAAALDACGDAGHCDALSAAAAALRDPGSVPSARVLDAIEQRHDRSYARFALASSLEHAGTLQHLRLPAEVEGRYTLLAVDSLAEQREIEAADVLPFESYRQHYLSPDRLKP
jgi:glutamate--cysteine ligase